ncbi:MAG: phosphoribosyltransferase family protein [Campylobacterota bacterium]|nr:phosphoribosyltransferase family protein [Campylobacterota bacterium]
MENIALAYYRDEVGKELLMFKKENSTAIYRWLHYVEQNFDEIFGDLKIDYIVRALGSNETSNESQNTPLDLMGGLLAKKFNAKYVTNILSKDRTTQLKFAGNKYNRKNILDHKYNCTLNGLKKDATYLVVDDVTTTGTTFDEINRAILEKSSNKVKLHNFALVETLWDRDYTNDKQSDNQKFYQQLIA